MPDQSAPAVAVVGASAKPHRFSHQCVAAYLAAGWTVWPVHPSRRPVHGLDTLPDLRALPGRPDIITMYLNPRSAMALLDDLVAANPEWLWLNPGADGDPIASAARARGLAVVESCNLVALAAGDPRDTARRLAR